MPGNRTFASASVSIMRAADRVGRPRRTNSAFKETEVERRIVRDQFGLAEERQHIVDDFGEAWLVG